MGTMLKILTVCEDYLQTRTPTQSAVPKLVNCSMGILSQKGRHQVEVVNTGCCWWSAVVLILCEKLAYALCISPTELD